MDVLLRFRRLVRMVCVALSAIGALSLMSMMFLVTADVARRNAQNEAILGTFELVEYLMVPVVFFGLALGQIYKSHISVEVVVGRISERSRAALQVITLMMALVFIAVIGWVNFDQTKNVFSLQQTSQVLLIPRWPFQAMTVVGAAVFCLAIFVDILIAGATALAGQSPSAPEKATKVLAD